MKLGGGEPSKRGGPNVAKFGVFLMQMMHMMQGFLADDASDALVFGKEPLPIVVENVIKICMIWRAGDANDASIQRWRRAVGIGVERGI